MLSRRLKDRLWRHHLPIGLGTLTAGWLLYATRGYPDVITRLSFASAWPALALLTVTLVIGPWRALRGRPRLLSQDLRRDWGIWAGIAGVFHVVIGQCVHLRGRPWLYYVYEKTDVHVVPLRHDLFGFANFTGLFAALILVTLLATSNDAMLRKLGNPGWKTLQRWNYACFALAGLHTFGYLLGVEAFQIGSVVFTGLCVAMAGTLQVMGWRHRVAG
jgi:sulfoxide reductase heme-binding subunit YedZ